MYNLVQTCVCNVCMYNVMTCFVVIVRSILQKDLAVDATLQLWLADHCSRRTCAMFRVNCCAQNSTCSHS